MSWLNTHLADFVKPYLGHIPEPSETKYFKPEEMTVIKNCWRSAKSSAQGKKILLAGRDVFIFEILARRENYPTLFIPECSRVSAKALQIEDKDSVFLFDTGFVGTIPGTLGIKNFKLVSYINKDRAHPIQVFPRLTMSRSLALKIEKTPKYWKTARLWEKFDRLQERFESEKVLQELSEKGEFENAAQLTLEVYRDSSPKFIDKPKPIGGQGWLLL